MTEQLPANTIAADPHYNLQTAGMAPGLALLFNDRLYERCKDVARIMAGAQGFTPPHLLGKTEACFGIVQMAITWKLTPQLVASSTYQTPAGRIGYEGKLVQAILENSGQLVGGVSYELYGDWHKVRGRHKKIVGDKGKDVFVQNWKPEDEEGLGVIVRAMVRGETEPREMEMFLASCWPRNSTLWALRPDQQIKYTACRAFASTVAPGIFMGVPFSTDAEDAIIDVTPERPRRADFGAAGGSLEEPKAEPEDKAPAEEEAEPPELDAASAYQMGQSARDRRMSLRALPGELRENATLADAWTAGWRDRESELAAGDAGTAGWSAREDKLTMAP